MIYQIRANLFFHNEGMARGLFNHIKGVFPQARDINPDSPDTEFSIIELIENYHDQDPAAPCDVIDRIASYPPSIPAPPPPDFLPTPPG